MGNAPLTIGLKVDNGKNGGIMAGSILYGRIYLSNKQGGTVNARSIRLKLIGTEDAVIHKTSEPGRNGNNNCGTRTTTRGPYERSSHIFYSIDHTMKEFPGGVIPKGQFEFPFAVQLPTSLPSSMKAKKSKSTCEVRYEVVAEVFQKPNTLLYSNPHAKEQLTVIAMPSKVVGSSLHLPVEIVPIRNLYFCYCTKVGTMALETNLDKDILLMDSPSSPSCKIRNKRMYPVREGNGHHKSFGVAFRCQNKSTVRVNSVKAELIETIEWEVNGVKETIKTTLATSTVDALQYPELDRLKHKPFSWQQHRPRSDIETNLLLEDRPWRTMQTPLGVHAALATDTYWGKAVEVRHALTVSVVTEGYCSTNPDVSACVEIYRNPVAFGGLSPVGFPSASASASASEFTSISKSVSISAPRSASKSALASALASKSASRLTSASLSASIFALKVASKSASQLASKLASKSASASATHDPLSCKPESHHTHTSSAPFENELFDPAPFDAPFQNPQTTAPSSLYDDASEAPMAEAQLMTEAQFVLPEDWNAQTAELVTIPIAEATALDS